MKYILIKNTFNVTKIKDAMINIGDPKSKEGRDWYQYLNPEEHFGVRVIHKDNVLLVASTQKDLAAQIKVNEDLRAKCLEAWQETLKKEGK